MNKIYFYYFIFPFIPRASPKELTKIPFIKISLFAIILEGVTGITFSPLNKSLVI